MTTPSRPTTRNVGRLTGFVLGLVVFVCVSMIGFAGYLKYELDRAESVLAASPEASGNTAQEPFDKLRRSLGYGGFIGLAQNYASSHDAALLPDMKAQIKTADDIVAHLPEHTSTEVRRDLISIMSMFDAAMQKADKSSSDAATTFTPADMSPLFTALPVLDDRLANASAINRLTAQNELQFWAMLLTLVSWASLIIAAAMSVGIYLSLRDRNSAPLRALAQSVKNMAQGDMRTSIWGMERTDMIGELARAFDLARYHFSQLPDMSLLSDQGPVRIRFEGNTKSMFEAMMQLITRDSEQVRVQATTLATTIMQQQEAIAQISAQIEAMAHNILQRGHSGDQQIKQVMHDVLGSAQSLKNAQEHAADQLNRIVPYLQERAQSMNEITQIAGKQVAQTLQSLTSSERGLKTSAEQSESAIKKLSTTADSLGDRLFGAINLLQASGKVLAETTETARNRLNEAVQFINHGGQPPAPMQAASAADTTTSPRLEALINALEQSQKKLEEVLHEQTQAARAQIDLLTTQSTSLLSQSTTTTQTLSSAADHLREEQAKLDRAVNTINGKLDSIGGKLEQQASEAFGKAADPAPALAQNDDKLADISEQIRIMAGKLSDLGQPALAGAFAPAPSELGYDTNLLMEIRSGFETTVRSLSQMREQLTNMVINVQTQMPVVPVAAADGHWQDIAAQIDMTRAALAQTITQQIDRLETRLAGINAKSSDGKAPLPEDAQQQMEQQTQILTELVGTLSALDAHMQEIRSQVSEIKGQRAG